MEKFTTSELCAIRDLLNDKINELHSVMDDDTQSDFAKALAYRLSGNYENIRDKVLNIIGSDCKRIAVERH